MVCAVTKAHLKYRQVAQYRQLQLGVIHGIKLEDGNVTKAAPEQQEVLQFGGKHYALAGLCDRGEMSLMQQLVLQFWSEVY